MKICSACLLGIRCRSDGRAKPDPRALALAEKEILIPACPEQMGGLPTPRERAEIAGAGKQRKVFSESGKDLTENFAKGAEEVLKLAKLFNIKEAILKQKSPSCGSGLIYDGTFSKKTARGDGITAALLKKNGIKVLSEEDLALPPAG